MTRTIKELQEELRKALKKEEKFNNMFEQAFSDKAALCYQKNGNSIAVGTPSQISEQSMDDCITYFENEGYGRERRVFMHVCEKKESRVHFTPLTKKYTNKHLKK